MTMQPIGFDGLIAATFTPLRTNGDLDLDRVPTVVEHLIEAGVSGLYVLGSTGEGVSLTVDERAATAAAFVDAVAHRIPVMVHVGSESIRQARLLAKRAVESGADAISAVSPVYFKPASADALVASMADVASATPDTPFYYYHIPAATGVAVDALTFLQNASSRIPSLCGVKFTSPVVHEFQSCVEYSGPRYEMLWGCDEMLLSGLTAGARAAVGSTYNFAAPISLNVMRSFRSGDIESARHWQSISQAIVRAFVPFGPRAAQKEIMKLIGVDCGPPRLPLTPLDENESGLLRAALDAIPEWRSCASLAGVDVAQVS